jgi:flagellar P-ring protein FlgI
MTTRFSIIILFAMTLCMTWSASASVRISELTRLDGARDNSLVGYGIVIGLNGTGDTQRSRATMQSVANTLQKFGVFVDAKDISSRNVSVAMVTATLPPFSENGSKLDVTVSSIGDARSIAGGTLLLTPLKAANGEVIALAQGELSVGGYAYQANGNSVQKNHPTVGSIPAGAIVERATKDQVIDSQGNFSLLLKEPDFRTAERISDAINSRYSDVFAQVVHAGKILISTNSSSQSTSYRRIASIQDIMINPVTSGRVVVNERTGTIVAGGDVVIDNVTISHGNLRLSVTTRYDVSQPNAGITINDSSFVNGSDTAARTVVVPETNITVNEDMSSVAKSRAGTTVSDLISTLNKMKMTTRDIITILQSLSRAGALHGDLIIQ